MSGVEEDHSADVKEDHLAALRGAYWTVVIVENRLKKRTYTEHDGGPLGSSNKRTLD